LPGFYARNGIKTIAHAKTRILIVSPPAGEARQFLIMGMALVYKVRHAVLESKHALKVLLPHLLREPGVLDRFLEESFDAIEEKYGWTPETPLVFEFFDNARLGSLRSELKQMGVVIDELEVPERSKLVGMSVSDLENTADGGFMVIAIRDPTGRIVHNPKRTHIINAGDNVLLMGHEGDMPDIARTYHVEINQENAAQEGRIETVESV